MRPNNLFLVIATPALCAFQPRTIAQVPVVVATHNVATSSYSQDAFINGSIAAISKTSTAEVVDPSNSQSAAAATADIPAPALDKSIFSLIVFGIAGLCLI